MSATEREQEILKLIEAEKADPDSLTPIRLKKLVARLLDAEDDSTIFQGDLSEKPYRAVRKGWRSPSRGIYPNDDR